MINVFSDLEMHRQLDVFGKLTQILIDQKSEITQQYPNQWVGLGEDKIMMFADNLDELVLKLKDPNDKFYVIAVEYLDPNPLPYVLNLN